MRDRAGTPNAKVLPLPVSAIPTTSSPCSAAGHVHAWMGVGALNFPLSTVNREVGTGYDDNPSKVRIGVIGFEGGEDVVMMFWLVDFDLGVGWSYTSLLQGMSG